MNKLETYLAEYFHPGGNTFKIVMVERDLKDSPFTLEEMFEMTLEAREAGAVCVFYNNVLFGKLNL